LVCINFLVNVVVNGRAEPVRAVAGNVDLVHRAGVQFGDEEVWGALARWKSDVTVVTLGPGETPRPQVPWETLRRAGNVTRESGTIICESKVEEVFKPQIGDALADEEVVNSKDVASFNAMLPRLSPSELMRIHEKRDWKLDKSTIQYRVKAVRGQLYRLKCLAAAETCAVLLTPDPTARFKGVVEKLSKADLRVNVLVGSLTTLPKISA
jgi:hypothetical protein